MRKMVLMVAVAMMFTLSLSLSATTLQMSQAGYYLSGADSATLFSSCTGIGCPGSSLIGTVAGPELFQIIADVEWDGTNTTYSYLLFDDASTPVDLTGLAVGTPGVIGTSTTPTGWNFMGAGSWMWLCNGGAPAGACNNAVTPGTFNVFSMTLKGFVAPTLQPVGITIGSGTQMSLITSPNWKAAGASTPEPASMLLLASGLLGGAFFRRRK